ncbi:AHH domain-containing protein [Flavobacterium cerinum]|uniref:AHH domain-containing protein n=1 Tax=Flavobacterium cerinum TaxID=2502784 RepID=A0ABY5IX14_9FLAO|nr:AHH domain-containing protein [Flavobacterium cerinum]UUC47349.1 AHH domain-containing protein [Flavobacterium cerinum]
MLPAGDVLKLTKAEKYIKTLKSAIKVINKSGVEKLVLTAAQRGILYGYKRIGASRLLGVALHAKGLVKKVGEQAHHLIPVNMIKKNAYIGNLVANGWDINKALNGKWLASKAEEGWAKGFHGNAPAYDQWIEDKINKYVKKNGSKGLESYIEGKLIPQADKLLDKMYETYKKTGKNMNDQFKELLK